MDGRHFTQFMAHWVSVPYLSGQALQCEAIDGWELAEYVSVPYLSGQALQSATRELIEYVSPCFSPLFVGADVAISGSLKLSG